MSLLQAQNTGFKKTVQGQGVVDSSGNCRIPFPPAASGTIESGSVTIYDSPIGIVWMELLNNQVVDTVVGQSTCGNIQRNGADVLEFVTSGLTGNIGQAIHATFFCVVTPEELTNLVIPGHDSLPTPGTYVRQVVNGVNYTISGGPPHTFNINLLASDQSLIIGVGVGSGPATFTVTGVTTQVAYLTGWQLFSGQEVAIPCYGQLDITVQIQITGITGNAIITIAAMPDDVQMGSNNQPINVMDGGSQYQYVTANVPAASNVMLLGIPPAGYAYRIQLMSVWADSTTPSASAHLGVAFGVNNTAISAYAFIVYSGANGTSGIVHPNILVAYSVWLHNTYAVGGTGTVVYRQEQLT